MELVGKQKTESLYTEYHWRAVGLYALAMLSISASDDIFITFVLAIVCSIAFLLITSWETMQMAIMISFILGGLSALFPPFALVAIVLAIYFFIRRFKFICSNWRAILVGTFTYASFFVALILKDRFEGEVFFFSS